MGAQFLQLSLQCIKVCKNLYHVHQDLLHQV